MNDTRTLEVGAPKTMEEVAMEKVTDPFSRPYPLWHVTHIRKLKPILSEGLVAENFAKRVGKTDFHRRFPSSWNDRNVSLRRGGSEGVQILSSSTMVAILVDPQDAVTEATENHWHHSDPFHPTREEFLVRNRIAPREFRGLQIVRSINEPPLISQATVSNIVPLLRRLDPNDSLPIYGLDGLLWPIKMTKEQLRVHVQSKV